ncbi:hypothetical protein D9M72_612380 [compost metagenome]
MQFFHGPEVVGQLLLAFGLEVKRVVGLVDVLVDRQLWAQVRWCRGDGGFERVGQWVAVTCGIDIHRQCGRTQYQAAKQGSEAQ